MTDERTDYERKPPGYHPSGRAIDDEVEELSFDEDERPPPRAGDPLSPAEQAQEIPPERVREAGMTGGENPGGGVTDDDLSPETLLNEDDTYGEEPPLDKTLREVGAAEIGAGFGRDEAELARDEHPDLRDDADPPRPRKH